MPRARIWVRQTSDRLTVTYRLPGRLLSPAAWFWSLVGGLAIGIAAALALVVAGAVDVDEDWRAFRIALAAGTASGAALLYLGYAWTVLRRRLRVVFDAAHRRVTLQLVAGERRAGRYPLGDIVLFRLAEHAAGPRGGCILVMETAAEGPVALLTLPEGCHTPATQLSTLAGQLNAYLGALRSAEMGHADDHQPA
jgi:hypothetical protein